MSLLHCAFFHIIVMIIIVLLAGEDYDPDPVNAVFTAGRNSTTVQIPILIDNKAEDDEQFSLTLVVPSELERLVRLGSLNTAVGTIKDSSGMHV